MTQLRAHGLHDYNESFNTMLHECRESDRVCNSLHDQGPWSSSSGSTALAKQMYAAQLRSDEASLARVGGEATVALRAAGSDAAAEPQGAATAARSGAGGAGAAEGVAPAEASALETRDARRKAFLQGALTPN